MAMRETFFKRAWACHGLDAAVDQFKPALVRLRERERKKEKKGRERPFSYAKSRVGSRILKGAFP